MFYLSIPWQLIRDGVLLSILEQVINCFGLVFVFSCFFLIRFDYIYFCHGCNYSVWFG